MNRGAGHYLKTASDRGTAGVSSVNVIVAASDSLHPERADHVCDGTADQIEFQAAIDAMPSPVGGKMSGGSGGSIKALPGTFTFSDTLNIDKNVRISGDAMTNTEIVMADSSDATMINYDQYNGTEGPCYGCILEHIKLSGNQANQSSNSYGIDGKLCDMFLDHVWIDDFDIGLLSSWMWSCYMNQISIEQCGSYAMFLNAGSGIIQHCAVDGLFCDGSIFIRGVISGGEVRELYFSNCYLGKGFGGNYHRIHLQGNVHDVHIYENQFRNTTPAGYYDIYTETHTEGEVRNISIENNHFKSTISAGSIYLYAACEKLNIHHNDFAHATPLVIVGGANSGGQIRDNIGWDTEKSGTATLANGTTSIVVTHGLDVTPSAGDIVVTPIEAWGAMTEFYIDTYTATQFTIHADQNPTQDVDFAWMAIVL